MQPVVLSIAGSDNSAGAGAQADLKTMSACGVYGVTAITCVVAEVPGRVSAIQAIDPKIVAEQIRLVFGAFPIGAVKTGMLYSREIMAAVCETLEEQWAHSPRTPLVIDPVMVATSGHSLLQSDAVGFYQERLFPIATVVTPNLDEVSTLCGRPVTNLAEMEIAGKELEGRFGTAFLLKGGHLRAETATDLLFCAGEVHSFSAPFVPGVSTHGTGCTYSAAIASGLARGWELKLAVAEAKRLVSRAIEGFFRWEGAGGRTDALDHFAGVIDR